MNTEVLCRVNVPRTEGSDSSPIMPLGVSGSITKLKLSSCVRMHELDKASAACVNDASDKTLWKDKGPLEFIEYGTATCSMNCFDRRKFGLELEEDWKDGIEAH